MNQSYRVAVDIGGTFTDVVVLNEATGELCIGKVRTTPSEPERGVIEGIGQVLGRNSIQASMVSGFIHATTLVSNAVIERKGAKAALISTRGFRDVLQIGRETRYDLYDLDLQLPEPLVPRQRRLEVTERIDATGKILVHLIPEDVRAASRLIESYGVTAVAVCLLHSYANNAHELRVRDLLLEEHPELFVSLSSEICPEIGEYERTSTTVVNAFVQPLVKGYLERLQAGLLEIGIKAEPFIMLSNGGLTSVQDAVHVPSRMIESGPAAGALAATLFGRLIGLDQLLAFDMGGTTAKLCVVNQGKATMVHQFEVARVHKFKKGSGVPIKAPAVDLIEIGAGGGSIAYVDEMGLLKVGPESSGADPGPVCYEQGGKLLTVTDADLLLGYLSEENLLGGHLKLNMSKCASVIEEDIGAKLQMDVQRVAHGIYDIVNEKMARAAQTHIAERGADPRHYTVIATGGAGSVHAEQLAKKIGARTVISPPGAGIASAIGLLFAPRRAEVARSYISVLDEVDIERVNALYVEMADYARLVLHRAGVEVKDVHFSAHGDMRLRGQGHEIQIPLPAIRFSRQDIEQIRASFEELYKTRFGRVGGKRQIETINWRLTAVERTSGDGFAKAFRARFECDEELSRQPRKGKREVYFGEVQAYEETEIFDRSALVPGDRVSGPAIIEAPETSVVVAPGSYCTVDEHLNLVITLGEGSRRRSSSQMKLRVTDDG